MENKVKSTATGGCLCGAVKYEIRGAIRGVVNCHCSKCRRFSDDKTLKWYRSIKDETPNVHRGFCCECGSSLFWDPRGRDQVAIAAGSLDEPTGLKTIGHVWMSQRGDFYELLDDLPRFDERWGN